MLYSNIDNKQIVEQEVEAIVQYDQNVLSVRWGIQIFLERKDDENTKGSLYWDPEWKYFFNSFHTKNWRENQWNNVLPWFYYSQKTLTLDTFANLSFSHSIVHPFKKSLSLSYKINSTYVKRLDYQFGILIFCKLTCNDVFQYRVHIY